MSPFDSLVESAERDRLLDDAMKDWSALSENLGTESEAAAAPDAVLSVLRELKTQEAMFAEPEIRPLRPTEVRDRLDGRAKRLLKDHAFYELRFPVTLLPRPNHRFARLTCQLTFRCDDPAQVPAAHDLAPVSEWDVIAEARLGLTAGVTEQLRFGLELPPSEALKAGARVHLKSTAGFVLEPRKYTVKRAIIVASGWDTPQPFWRLEQTDFLDGDAPAFGVILRVPEGAASLRAEGLLAAYQRFDWFSATLAEFLRECSEKVQTFFREGAPLACRAGWDFGRRL